MASRRPGRRFAGERGYGIIGDIVIGIVGVFLGCFLASLIGLDANGLVGTIIIAFIGACILIVVLRFFSRRSPRLTRAHHLYSTRAAWLLVLDRGAYERCFSLPVQRPGLWLP